jgi:2-oxoisovalerate dehydrogenase E1 component
MVKELEVCPVFLPGTIELGAVPTFQYQRALSEEIGRRLSREQAAAMLEWMLTVRGFEQMVVGLKDGTVKPYEGFSFTGATHLSIGQEAVAVGTMAALRGDDYITSTHRGHGHSIAKGGYAILAMTAERLAAFLGEPYQGQPREELLPRALQLHLGKTMAELLGREDGYCRGRGGGMHIADFYVNHLGANAIVGGSLGIATGAGLAAHLLGTDQVVVCLFGDGAANNGIFHESLNFACMDQFEAGLPVVYLIENNQYGMTGQQRGEVTGIDYLARRGAAYNEENCRAEVVNGMDVLSVWDAVSRAAEQCRAGRGPVLLECLTYRYFGHSLSDQRVKYRTAEEEAEWRACDAIDTYKAKLLEAGAMSEEGIAQCEAAVGERLREALRFAAASPEPDPATIGEGLFCDTSADLVEAPQRTEELLSPMREYRRDSKGRIMYRHAVCEALAEEMMRDRRVVLFGEDVADYGGAFQVTVGLLETFGRKRVFNTAISEAAIVGVAAGASMCGIRPVAEIMYIDFLPLALDQVANQAAKTRYMFGGKAKLPLVVRTTVGGGKGYAGQHSQSLEAMVTQVPGLKVVAPSTAYDAKGLLKSAIRDDNPVIFIEHQLLYTEKDAVPAEEYTVPLGAATVRREGKDLTIVAYLMMARVAMEAAELLAAEGIEAEVIDPRTLIPLDVDTIVNSVRKTGRLMVVCQAPKTGCFGEHIAYRVQEAAFPHLKAPMRIVAAYDVPPPMAQTLEAENLPDAKKVAREGKALVGRKVRAEMSTVRETEVSGFKIAIVQKPAFEAVGFTTFVNLDGVSIPSFVRGLTESGRIRRLAATLDGPQQIWVCLSGEGECPEADCRCTVCVERTPEHDFSSLDGDELFTLHVPASAWAVFEVGVGQSPSELHRADVYRMVGEIGYAFNHEVGLHFDNEHEWQPGKTMRFLLPVIR